MTQWPIPNHRPRSPPPIRALALFRNFISRRPKLEMEMYLEALSCAAYTDGEERGRRIAGGKGCRGICWDVCEFIDDVDELINNQCCTISFHDDKYGQSQRHDKICHVAPKSISAKVDTPASQLVDPALPIHSKPHKLSTTDPAVKARMILYILDSLREELYLRNIKYVIRMERSAEAKFEGTGEGVEVGGVEDEDFILDDWWEYWSGTLNVARGKVAEALNGTEDDAKHARGTIRGSKFREISEDEKMKELRWVATLIGGPWDGSLWLDFDRSEEDLVRLDVLRKSAKGIHGGRWAKCIGRIMA